MFKPCIFFKCFGHYNELNAFCVNCNVATECYEETNEIEV